MLSIGVFFTLMIVGLAAALPATLHDRAGGPRRAARPTPPASRSCRRSRRLFAAFLGYNPMQTLLGAHILRGLPAAQAQTLTGRSFFPHLISGRSTPR